MHVNVVVFCTSFIFHGHDKLNMENNWWAIFWIQSLYFTFSLIALLRSNSITYSYYGIYVDTIRNMSDQHITLPKRQNEAKFFPKPHRSSSNQKFAPCNNLGLALYTFSTGFR